MAVRRAFFSWLLPAAFLLPLWLMIGWGIFNAGGWAFVWVLFVAIPSVFIGQLVAMLLVRSRPSVRETRAVSWFDILGFTIWHALTIAVGFYPESAFFLLVVLAIVGWLGLFWSSLWQLWSEARGRLAATVAEVNAAAAPRPRTTRDDPAVVIIHETLPPPESPAR